MARAGSTEGRDPGCAPPRVEKCHLPTFLTFVSPFNSVVVANVECEGAHRLAGNPTPTTYGRHNSNDEEG